MGAPALLAAQCSQWWPLTLGSWLGSLQLACSARCLQRARACLHTAKALATAFAESRVAETSSPPDPHDPHAVPGVVRYGLAPGQLDQTVVGDKDLVYSYVYGPDAGGMTYQASGLGLGGAGWMLKPASLPPIRRNAWECTLPPTTTESVYSRDGMHHGLQKGQLNAWEHAAQQRGRAERGAHARQSIGCQLRGVSVRSLALAGDKSHCLAAPRRVPSCTMCCFGTCPRGPPSITQLVRFIRRHLQGAAVWG